MAGEVLYLYVAVGEKSISSVLVKEVQGVQKPIYFVSRILQGPKERYSELEKAELAVITMARKLCPYFLSHVVRVLTNLSFKKTLGRPDLSDLSGRMVKWVVELGKYEVEFESRAAIKAQVLADFLQETMRAQEDKVWEGFVDGPVTKE